MRVAQWVDQALGAFHSCSHFVFRAGVMGELGEISWIAMMSNSPLVFSQAKKLRRTISWVIDRALMVHMRRFFVSIIGNGRWVVGVGRGGHALRELWRYSCDPAG